MRLLIDITHPAHFHFFRNAMDVWRSQGAEILVATRDKDITLELLDLENIPYHCLSKQKPGLVGLGAELLSHEFQLFKLIKEFKPDALLQIGGTHIVHVGKLTGVPSIVFYDTENAVVSNTITYPFADVICTPASYNKAIGKKQVTYNGYQEMAYMHPNWFTPDQSILKEAGIEPGETFSVVRFVGWTSGHDVNLKGFSSSGKLHLIKELRKFGKVFISSESPLPDELNQYSFSLPKTRIHHLLAFAKLFIGESATMASECAIIGTPAIFVSPVGRGYTDEQDHKYGLVFNFLNSEEELAIDKAVELLSLDDLKKQWAVKRDAMLKDKVDVTKWIIDFVDSFLKNRKRSYRNFHERQN